MKDHESPISINTGSGTLAKAIISDRDGHRIFQKEQYLLLELIDWLLLF